MNKRHLAFILALCMIFTLLPVSVSAADDFDEYRIYYDGKNTGIDGFYVKGNVYVPVSMIGTYFSNANVSYDTNKMQLYLDTANMNMMLADDEVTSLVKNYCGTAYIPLKKINDTVCFSMNGMESFFHTSFAVNGSNIKLRSYDGTVKVAKVGSENITATPSLFSETDEKITIAAGQRIFIEGQSDNFYKISDYDGNMYYVAKKGIALEDLDLSSVDLYAPRKAKYVQAKNEKINVVWQYVDEVSPEAPSSINGIDIMAPTWFRLIVEGGGAVTNSGDRGYTDLCHENGFMVWATITNNMSEKGSTNFTTKMFSDSLIQKKAIAQYIFYSILYDVDGINIDFEDVKDADANGLTNFTKEMRYYTERQGLNLSIDTLVPKPWTIEYDRDALAKYVDYLAVMSYDEHYAGSALPGSVSSLPFVVDAIEGCIEEGVPAEKLLMGVPLYTRVWVVNSSGKIVSNNAATMDRMQEILINNNIKTTYLSKEQQNYAEYMTSLGTAKVWIEDATSIKNRLNLVSKYNIAGSACWQYSQGTASIWEIFDDYLH